MGQRFGDAQEIGCYELWQLQVERNKLAQAYVNRWTESGIDALISPTTPFSAVQHDKFKHTSYTGIWNVLDYSAASLPTGLKVDQDQDTITPGRPFLSETDKTISNECKCPLILPMTEILKLSR